MADWDWADKKAIEVFRETDGCVGLGDMADALRQARQAALEEAAKMIERFPDPGSARNAILAVESCAHAIRSLKDKSL